MTAVIRVGGKTYRVSRASTLTVDRLNHEVGSVVQFPDLLGGADVEAKVVRHILADKVLTLRFRNKTRYSRTVGHRQPQTVLAFSAPLAQNKK